MLFALQLIAKHTKYAQNVRKLHFSACLAVFLMCALCAIWHFSAFYGCFYAHSMSVHVYTRFLASAFATSYGTCWLLLPRQPARLLRLQRYDTKTILTNFCVKISQWNAFLGRRRHFFRIVLGRMMRHTFPQCCTLTHNDGRQFLAFIHGLHAPQDMADMVFMPRKTAHFPPAIGTSCILFNTF